MFCLRKHYNSVRDDIDRLSPLNLTEHEFTSGVVDQMVRESEHKSLSRKLRAFSLQIDHVRHFIDAIEKGLCIVT
jgi:hypothetical protein